MGNLLCFDRSKSQKKAYVYEGIGANNYPPNHTHDNGEIQNVNIEYDAISKSRSSASFNDAPIKIHAPQMPEIEEEEQNRHQMADHDNASSLTQSEMVKIRQNG